MALIESSENVNANVSSEAAPDIETIPASTDPLAEENVVEKTSEEPMPEEMEAPAEYTEPSGVVSPTIVNANAPVEPSQYEKNVNRTIDAEESEASGFDALKNELADIPDAPPTPQFLAEEEKRKQEEVMQFDTDFKQKTVGIYEGVKQMGEFYDTVKPVVAGDKSSQPVPVDNSFLQYQSLGRALNSAAAGFEKSGEDLANGVKVLANFAEDFFASRGYGDGKWIDESAIKFPEADEYANTMDDQLVYMAARYLSPFGILNKGLKAMQMGAKTALAVSAGSEAMLTGLTHDPKDELLSNMAQKNKWMIAPLLSLTAVEPDDSPIEVRIKAAAESVLTMGVGLAVGKSLSVGSKVAGRGIDIVKDTNVGGKLYSKAEVATANLVAAIAEKANLLKVQKEAARVADVAKSVMNNPKVKKAIGKTDEKSISIVKAAQKVVDDELAAEKLAKSLPLDKVAQAEVDEMVKYRSGPSIEQEVLSKGLNTKTAKQLIESMDMHKDPMYIQAFNDMKRNKIPLKQIHEKAKVILSDEKKLAAVLERTPGTAVTAEEYVAVQMLAEGAANRVRNLGNIPLNKMTSVQKLMMDEALADLAYYATNAKGGLSEAARTMRGAQKAWKGADTPYKKHLQLKEYLKLAGSDLDKRVEMMQMAIKEGASIPEMAIKAAKVGPGVTDKISNAIYTNFVNAACAKVQTFLGVNMGSNMANYLVQDTLESAMESLLPGGLPFLKSQEAKFTGFKSTFLESLSMGKKIMQTGEVPQEFAGKYFTEAAPVFTKDADTFLQKTAHYGKMGYFLPGRSLNAGDSMQRLVLSRGKINQYAAHMAEGLEGATEAQKKAHFDNLRVNAPDAFNMAADGESRELTFARRTEDLALLPRTVGQFAEAGQKVFNIIPGGKVLLPFIGITANTADSFLMRTPLAATQPEFWNSMKAGGATQRKALAKVMAGTSLMAVGAVLQQSGIIKNPQIIGKDLAGTRGPGDPGYGAYLHVGEAAIKVAALGIPGLLIMAGADSARMLSHLTEDDIPDVTSFVLETALGVGKKISPEAMHESMVDTLAFINDLSEGKVKGDALGRRVGKFIESGMTPYRWTYINANQLLSSGKYDTTPEDPELQGFVNNVIAQTKNSYKDKFGFIGAANDLPPLVNIFNEQIDSPVGVMHDIRSAVYGGEPADPKKKEVRDWLKKLGAADVKLPGIQNQVALDLHIPMPSRKIPTTIDGVSSSVTLNSKQYREMIEIINEPINGKTLTDELMDIKNIPMANTLNQRTYVKRAISQRTSRAKQKIRVKYEDINAKAIDRIKTRMEYMNQPAEGEQ